MPNVRYIGPAEAIEVPEIGTVARGDYLAVSDELAARMLNQPGNWERAPALDTGQHAAPGAATTAALSRDGHGDTHLNEGTTPR